MKIKKKENVCIIPARGGSKRIPLKNIKKFQGVPIIVRSIKKAISSKLFDKIIVTTDNKQIANLAKKNGAQIHIRSKKLSDDYTDTISVIKNVIEKLNYKKIHFKKVCCIYPTSIFYDFSDLKKGLKMLSKKRDYIFSAIKYDHPVYRSFIKKEKKLKMVFSGMEKKRTQDLPKTYYDAAQFYFGWKSSWEKRKKIFDKKSDFVEISKYKSQDLDEPSDWIYAERLWRLKN